MQKSWRRVKEPLPFGRGEKERLRNRLSNVSLGVFRSRDWRLCVGEVLPVVVFLQIWRQEVMALHDSGFKTILIWTKDWPLIRSYREGSKTANSRC